MHLSSLALFEIRIAHQAAVLQQDFTNNELYNVINNFTETRGLKPGSEKNLVPNSTWTVCKECKKDNGYDLISQLNTIHITKQVLF